MAKPRIVSQKKGEKSEDGNKPRVVREEDYSRVLKWTEEEQKTAGDEPAQKLRKDALKDITPVENKPEPVQGDEKGILKRLRKKLFG